MPPRGDEAAIAEVRELSRHGRLSGTIAAHTGVQRRRLIGAVYTIAMPVVFTRVTRRMELRRGHHACATSVRHLTDDCMDRFEDDMEAVVFDVERRATLPIRDLEAWIASRVGQATVDGYRRRRGAVGALQRPRLPRWLGEELACDRWLCELALKILSWAGSPVTAGIELWPTEAWRIARAEFRDDRDGGGIRGDLATVLAAMRTRPAWFEAYVEGPLGYKQTPVAWQLEDDRGHPAEHAAFTFVDRDEQDDAQLRVLAHQAFEAIRLRIGRGEGAHAVVVDVIGTIFGGTAAGPADDRSLAAMRDDPVERNRIVAAVLALLDEPGAF
ncbi:hypothetical protein KZZ52_13210 [Dactylosporangium sp. AC04546]|uniref:hypothetical protein n=1 Tax=Dactylosporangium sp. AC04546 TaxID=2862460 RepID=UPI001EDEB4BE|nr:hypothetical protein [Dactylosporangium sp. AC04546]WVK86285.1 hypothetical protein KZZ52_13210 [Dactylosporangium sp. AC04546]